MGSRKSAQDIEDDYKRFVTHQVGHRLQAGDDFDSQAARAEAIRKKHPEAGESLDLHFQAYALRKRFHDRIDRERKYGGLTEEDVNELRRALSECDRTFGELADVVAMLEDKPARKA